MKNRVAIYHESGGSVEVGLCEDHDVDVVVLHVPDDGVDLGRLLEACDVPASQPGEALAGNFGGLLVPVVVWHFQAVGLEPVCSCGLKRVLCLRCLWRRGGGCGGWAGTGGGRRRVDGPVLLGSWNVHGWCSGVRVEWCPGACSEVDGGVCILWIVVVAFEAVFDLEL